MNPEYTNMLSNLLNKETAQSAPWVPDRWRKKIGEEAKSFIGKPELCLFLVYTIIRLRRKLSPVEDWRLFKEICESYCSDLLPHFSSRWLISIMDTYADFGTSEERNNATLVSSFFNLLKLFETERLMLKDPLIDLEIFNQRKRKCKWLLWDGMTVFWIEKGDMLSNLLQRIHTSLHFSSFIEIVFLTLLQRAVTHDTILRRMARINKTLASSLSLSLSLSLSRLNFWKLTRKIRIMIILIFIQTSMPKIHPTAQLQKKL